MFIKGDILLPLDRVKRKNWLKGLFHPAVVWEDTFDGKSDFSGIMLTHRAPNNNFNNVLMASTHFAAGYEVAFSNTYFVNQIFIKFHEWGEFELVGKLTDDGIDFIESNLNSNAGTTEFTVYLNSLIGN